MYLHRSLRTSCDWTKPASPRQKNDVNGNGATSTPISRLVASGADIKLTQTIAGHSNPLITLKRYSHLLDQCLTQPAQQFDPWRSIA